MRRLVVRSSAEAVLLLLALALDLGLLLPLLFASPQRHVDFLSDDAYYYFRVAMHLAAGDGPTFGGLTRTTGFHRSTRSCWLPARGYSACARPVWS